MGDMSPQRNGKGYGNWDDKRGFPFQGQWWVVARWVPLDKADIKLI